MANPYDTQKDVGSRLNAALIESTVVPGQAVMGVAGPGGGSIPVVMGGGAVTLTPSSAQVVVAAGPTATRLAAAASQADIAYIIANITNLSTIYLGASGVTTATGLAMEPGRGITLESCDLNTIYIIGTAGEGVSWFKLT